LGGGGRKSAGDASSAIAWPVVTRRWPVALLTSPHERAQAEAIIGLAHAIWLLSASCGRPGGVGGQTGCVVIETIAELRVATRTVALALRSRAGEGGEGRALRHKEIALACLSPFWPLFRFSWSTTGSETPHSGIHGTTYPFRVDCRWFGACGCSHFDARCPGVRFSPKSSEK